MTFSSFAIHPNNNTKEAAEFRHESILLLLERLASLDTTVQHLAECSHSPRIVPGSMKALSIFRNEDC
jgi:hypothetical protein